MCIRDRYHDSACREVLKDCNVTVLCDIENPLYGENGAAYVFAPQKGADGEMVRELDEGLRHLAALDVYKRQSDGNRRLFDRQRDVRAH